MRRALVIVAVVIVLTGVGVFVYLRFFANLSSVVVTPATEAGFPSAGQGAVNTGQTSSTFTTAGPVSVSARLVQIAKGPIALGESVVDASSTPTIFSSATLGTSTSDVLVSYIDRQSGNVYVYSENAGHIVRTSDKTLPGIENAFWLPSGRAAFVQYLSGTDFSTVNTYLLQANGTNGFFLPQDLSGLDVSSTSILALASGLNGSVASREHFDGAHATQVFSTPLSSIRASFAGKNQYLVFTKPSALLEGDAYLVGTSGLLSRIAGPLLGLSALASPSGKLVLVSYSEAGVMKMELVTTATGAVTPLPLGTIADKCAWTADSSAIYCGVPVDPPTTGVYPDSWYQGVTHFSDNLWKIDVAGRYAQLVLNFTKETGGSLDAESLAIDPSGSTLAFINKNDGSLWSYRL